MLDYFDHQGEFVPKSLVKEALLDLGRGAENRKDFIKLHMSGDRGSGFGAPLAVDNTLESHYLQPQLLIENSPSKTVRKIDDIQHISVENSDEVPIKVIEKSKEDRENMRRAQQQRIKEEDAQKKEIAEKQRVARAKEQAEEIKKLREQRHQEHQKATEVASSAKFENPDDLITTFESMESLANGTSSEITKEVLQKYNRLRQAFGLRHVAKVANMGLVQTFLNDNRNTYKEIKKTHKPTTSIVPTARFGKGTIVKGSDLLTSHSEPKILPPIEIKGGGGAKKQHK
jgi:hypothetical protein